MNSSLTAKELRAAAALAESRMLAGLGLDEASPHEFSEAFELKMEPVLKKARRMERTRQTARTIAASLAVVVLFGLIWVATHAEAREAVGKWFKYQWDHHVFYEFTEKYTGEFPTFRPTWLPEGYEEAYELGYETYGGPVINALDVFYKNEIGQYLQFTYHAMDEEYSTKTYLPDNYKHESVLIRGMPGDLYLPPEEENSDRCSLYWVDEENCILCGVFGILEPDAKIRMAESVAIVEPQK
jgi:hypothetical protein